MHAPAETMDFKDATDILLETPRVTVERIADAFDRNPHTITRARMSGEHARTPPSEWEPVLARMAREHAEELRARVAKLERLAENLEGDG